MTITVDDTGEIPRNPALYLSDAVQTLTLPAFAPPAPSRVPVATLYPAPVRPRRYRGRRRAPAPAWAWLLVRVGTDLAVAAGLTSAALAVIR